MMIMELLGLQNENVRINANAGEKIQNLTKTHFRNLTDELKIALLDLYKYDFEMFDYDPNMYLEI